MVENSSGIYPEGSLLARAHEHNLKRNVLFNALDIITDPEEMRRFVNEYADCLTSLRTDIKDPLLEAKNSVGYAAGYISNECLKRWSDAVPGLRHPMFGTHLPSPAEAVEVYARGAADQEIIHSAKTNKN